MISLNNLKVGMLIRRVNNINSCSGEFVPKLNEIYKVLYISGDLINLLYPNNTTHLLYFEPNNWDYTKINLKEFEKIE